MVVAKVGAMVGGEPLATRVRGIRHSQNQATLGAVVAMRIMGCGISRKLP